MTRRTNAKIAGIAYLFYIAVGVANELLMSRATRGEGTAEALARVAQHATDVRLAVLFGIGESFAALALAVTMYAVTRDVGRELALMALVCRVAEGLINAVNVPKHMALVWLAGATTGPGALEAGTTNALGTLFLMPGAPVGAVFFAVGSTLFCYLLLRGRMVPVILAGFGVVSSALLVIGLPLQLAEFVTGPRIGFLWLPEFAFAFAIGIWLVTKGVNEPVTR